MENEYKLPDGRLYEEVIIKNKHYCLYRNNVLEAQHQAYCGVATGKYYELYKYINHDELFGGRTGKHLTFIQAYKTKGAALHQFKKRSAKYGE